MIAKKASIIREYMAENIQLKFILLMQFAEKSVELVSLSLKGNPTYVNTAAII
jgi:hypothetical protein